MSEFAIPSQQKAIILSGELKPKVTTIPTFEPSDDTILIKSKAFALNPTDWKHIEWMKAVGSIIGSDVSGTVIKVGKNVKDFKIGDNVSTFLHGSYKPLPYPGAFQEYVVANPLVTYKHNYDLEFAKGGTVPAGVIDTWEGAASLTMSLVTSALSLYYSLGLDKSQDYSQESILIWSGATSTGCILIQLAKWLGFKDIITTASPKRWELLKKLGATAIFDYQSDDVVNQIKSQFGENIIYGIDTFSSLETLSNCYLALSNTKPIAIDNLLSKTELDLTVPLKEKPVKWSFTVVYLASGEDMLFNGITFKAEAELLERHKAFQRDIQPMIDTQRIKHIPLHILENDFESLIEGLNILQNGDYGNEKLVTRLL